MASPAAESQSPPMNKAGSVQTPERARVARKRTRPPVVQDRIVSHVRERIIGGHLRPGERVPGRVELERRFKVSNLTVQRAFDRLVADGFVIVHGRRGTYVADQPPHLRRYGLVFPCRRGDRDWVGFWEVMCAVAPGLLKAPKEVVLFEGVSGRKTDGDLALLNEDVLERRLAGVIFASPPFLVREFPALTEPGTPRLAIGSEADRDVPCTLVPEHRLIERAVTWLASRGRRRIALISPWTNRQRESALFAEALAAHGLAYEPRRIQGVPPSWAQWAANITLMLMHGPADERPDGLIVADDNLVQPACEAIQSLGLSTPGDLEIVAHCNFPEPAPMGVMVHRLGYDVPGMLRRCIELLDDQRAGRPVEPAVSFPIQFEWELGKT